MKLCIIISLVKLGPLHRKFSIPNPDYFLSVTPSQHIEEPDPSEFPDFNMDCDFLDEPQTQYNNKVSTQDI